MNMSLHMGTNMIIRMSFPMRMRIRTNTNTTMGMTTATAIPMRTDTLME